MTEAKIVRKIVAHLRASLPGAVVFKHADLVTAGVPDISVTFRGKTVWLEVKLLTGCETRSSLSRHFNRLQLATMRLLQKQCLVYYLTAYPDKKGLGLALLLPDGIAEWLEDDLGVLSMSGLLLYAHTHLGSFKDTLANLTEKVKL